MARMNGGGGGPNTPLMPFKSWKCVIDEIAPTFQRYCLCYSKGMSVKYKRILFRLFLSLYIQYLLSLQFKCRWISVKTMALGNFLPTLSLNQRFCIEADNRPFRWVAYISLGVFFSTESQSTKVNRCKVQELQANKDSLICMTCIPFTLIWRFFSFSSSNTFSFPARPSAVGSWALCVVYSHARYPLPVAALTHKA